jgi:hypothetical protein
VLPKEGEMGIMTATMPRIGGRVVPQQLELVGDEEADDGWYVLERVREIAQILHRFE